MRSIRRTLDRALARDIGLVCLADCLVGVSYGAIAVSSGFPLWLPMLMSLLVFAGASQFMFIGIVAAGGNPFAAVLAGLLANARHLPFGFAVGDVVGERWARLLGSHLMSDETVAFAMAQDEARRRRAAYWACGLGIFVFWNAGVLAGAFAGTAISDTSVFGLDAAFPAVLLALVLPSLRDRAARLPVLIGVVVALAATPFLPAGLPVLLALAGVVVGALAKEPELQEVG
ncbi:MULTISPECIES: AzlC family ABC transporter permease [unclassified Amycolatopsis]|uniref:AzlC family ABC transporter permease n=1 Tax=unclassified Amycolatopsis TaxID=2618356 RepID=UPI002875DF8B|nr:MULTISPECIES: AzlC family ABC transporter permease [unclassified Amycolatopsis]MDS0134801.1 AzlC family ABC transporter permease [Amycolatopsis sp. 505]MDS0148023.1 AzlC family ABC transporter permease [Amycolatopsis sp. CM201R]